MEALFEAPALWGEEMLLEELGLDRSIIEKRIKIYSSMEKEIEFIICGERCRNLVENSVKEHIELVKKHWSNVRSRDTEGIYSYVANELARMLGNDFMREYMDSVRGRRTVGCRIVYNPSGTHNASIIPRIDLLNWLGLLSAYGKKSITIE
ncbi:MAG: hypothetical protein DRO12_01480 [Thermoprotei archaeon]|nr:MAG: hypothetical protein DRO12_01480 [Thermoprotei archaeon]